MDESDLIEMARRGDRDAFGELVGLYQGRLRSYTAQFVATSADVYDIVQDAFLDALAHVGDFDPAREFYPWLRGICRNRILNYFRARRTRRGSGQTIVDAAIEDVLASREDRDDATDRLHALRHCLDKLSAPERDLLGLRYTHGIAIKEIAVQVRRSAAGISMHLHRIRTALLECVTRRLRVAEQ